MIPGEVHINSTDTLELNAGTEAITIEVTNTGDRPVQIGSHFHFYEVNHAIEFDRKKAWGKRLDIPAGTAVRLEPGDSRTVNLIDYAGDRMVYGFNGEVNGPLD